jgi:hypothetical protein
MSLDNNNDRSALHALNAFYLIIAHALSVFTEHLVIADSLLNLLNLLK